ncbi:predicted protein [Uncinocarpus reesii 1704]|uniref:Uncharacterized protein n=1 Tax=Uncinocarpus reesii (strain UAMH 1704) TaxID=336963 RepID=C4JFQ8_UNCRE|nr:uncharacterized protein UREG_02392 [Uncinocarpus reesii 1704]EEP77543.1 predicted protein [Uncinocarpus reesii 1704]
MSNKQQPQDAPLAWARIQPVASTVWHCRYVEQVLSPSVPGGGFSEGWALGMRPEVTAPTPPPSALVLAATATRNARHGPPKLPSLPLHLDCKLQPPLPLRPHADASFSIAALGAEFLRQGDPKPFPICHPSFPWADFLEGQEHRFDEVYDLFNALPEPAKLFPTRRTLEELGELICDRLFASEDDLRPHQLFAVETPVRRIVAALREMEEAQERFQLGQGIIFESHQNTLDEEVEEVQELLLARELAITGGKEHPKLVKPDRICVYRDLAGQHTLSYLVEYKPPHKLTVSDLKKGLRSMNIQKEVIQEYRIPINDEKKLQFAAEKKVARAVSQTFHYMIESGLEYSYLSTGKAFVFLRVGEADPTTLFYYCFTPDEKVHASDDLKAKIFQTSIAQVLAFSLLAFTAERRSPDWREHWRHTLPKWPVDGGGMVPRTPEKTNKRKTPPSSDFKGRRPSVSRSYELRVRKRNTCKEDEVLQYSDSDERSSSESESGNREIRVAGSRTGLQQETVPDSPTPVRTRERTQRRDYCTQSCLLGLACGGSLDENCPNASAHRVSGSLHYAESMKPSGGEPSGAAKNGVTR